MDDRQYSIVEVRERFEQEILDVSTDITTMVNLVESDAGLVLRFVHYPVSVRVEEPSNLDDAAAAADVERSDLPTFSAEVNLSISAGTDEDGNRTGIGLLVNLFGTDGEVYGFAERDDSGAWGLDEVARILGIAPDAQVWDVTG